MGLIERYKVYKSTEKYLMENSNTVTKDVRSVTEWTWRGITGYTEYAINQKPMGFGVVAHVCREIRRNGNDVFCCHTACPDKTYYGRFARKMYEMIEQKYNEHQR